MIRKITKIFSSNNPEKINAFNYTVGLSDSEKFTVYHDSRNSDIHTIMNAITISGIS